MEVQINPEAMKEIAFNTVNQSKYRMLSNNVEGLYVGNDLPVKDIIKVIRGAEEYLRDEKMPVFFQPFIWFSRKKHGALLTSNGVHINDKKYGKSEFTWGDISDVYATGFAILINDSPVLKFNTGFDGDIIFYLLLLEVNRNIRFFDGGRYPLNSFSLPSNCLVCASKDAVKHITAYVYGVPGSTWSAELAKKYAAGAALMGSPLVALIAGRASGKEKRKVISKIKLPVCSGCRGKLSKWETNIGGGFYHKGVSLISDPSIPETLDGNRYIVICINHNSANFWFKNHEYGKLMKEVNSTSNQRVNGKQNN